MKAILWNWIPKISIGPFLLGDQISRYISDYEIYRVHSELEDRFDFEWKTYAIPGHEARIHVSEGVIENVACYEICLYKGFNLIGASLASALERLDRIPDEHGEEMEIDDELQTPVEFWDLELELWLRPDKTIACAFCREECIDLPPTYAT